MTRSRIARCTAVGTGIVVCVTLQMQGLAVANRRASPTPTPTEQGSGPVTPEDPEPSAVAPAGKDSRGSSTGRDATTGNGSQIEAGAGRSEGQINQPPTVTPINAEATPDNHTFYSVEAQDPEGAPLTFAWSKVGNHCGTFAQDPNQARRAIWDYSTPDCPPPPHSSTITVVVSDGQLDCTATYTGGTNAGTGSDPLCDSAVVDTFNSIALFNVAIEPELKPPCDCSAEMSGGIFMSSDDICPKKCEEVGGFNGIVQDAGPHSVYLHSGEFFLNETDLSIPGRGFDWTFQRTYRSGVTFEGPLGHNWEFNYNRRLFVVTDTNLDTAQQAFPDAAVGDVVRMDGGRTDLYEEDGNGNLEAPTGFYTELEEKTNGTRVERDYAGTVVTYGEPDSAGLAPMISLADRHGNKMRFEYNDLGQLVTVIDTLGRPITYSYNADRRLEEITDFSGRVISFDFNSDGDLISVTSPSVTGTPTNNNFPSGRTDRYTYASSQTDPLRNHNLLTITSPNEVASGGPPMVQVAYDAQDRVTSQTVGGTNQTGVPAGGTIAYTYASLGGDPSNPNSSVTKTTVTDRNGNHTEYEFNAMGNILKQRELTNRDVRPSDPGAYETSFSFSPEGELLSKTFPEGNSIEYTYDDSNGDRLQQGNLVGMTALPDPARGGDQTELTTTYSYEPIYNQIRTITEPRGNDPNFAPPNGGATSPGRYRATDTFDYQEGKEFKRLARNRGVTVAEVKALLSGAGVPMGLGDINNDGTTGQTAGMTIRTQLPKVRLLSPCSKPRITQAKPNCSLQARVEGGTKQSIVELNSFNKYGQPLRVTDGEGNVDTFTYHPENDPDGDGQDATSGIGTGPFGYLKMITRDAVSAEGRNSKTDPKPAKVRASFAYDIVGNLVRQVNGRGIATDYTYNQLNEVVEVSRAAGHGLLSQTTTEPLDLTDFAYSTRYLYDANGNIALYQVEDRGDTSGVDGNPPGSILPSVAPNPDPGGGTAFIDMVIAYDILDNRLNVHREVSNGVTATFILDRYRYDANENLTLYVQPDGNARTLRFDERDLVFRLTRGATGPSLGTLLAPVDPTSFDVKGGTPSVSASSYDKNGNLIELSDAEDTDASATNNSTIGVGDRSRFLYDGFDRATSYVDAIGNQMVAQYDPAGNIVRLSRFGPIGGSSPNSDGPAVLPGPVSSDGIVQSANLIDTSLLASVATSFDELSRPYEEDHSLFVNTIPTERDPDIRDGAQEMGKLDLTPDDDCSVPGLPAGSIPSGDLGCVTTRTEFDRSSRPTFMIEDDGDTWRTSYDGIDREIKIKDPEGNTSQAAYDGNDNVIETLSIDVSQVRGVPSERFLTTNFYDALDRVQQTVDNLGRSTDSRYDSRGNLVAVADSNGPVGNTTIDRRSFAKGARTVNTINGFGNVTLMTYDGLDRNIRQRTVMTASGRGDGLNIGADLFGAPAPFPTPDPTQAGDGLISTQTVWNNNFQPLRVTDDNGNTTSYLYDNLDRMTRETKGSCEPGSLSDRCDPPTTITYRYDRDDNITETTDEAGSVTLCSFDALNRTTGCNITRGPGVIGTSAMTFEYDGLSRLTKGTDNNDPTAAGDDAVVSFAYDSLSRVIEESQRLGAGPPGVISSSWRAENLRSSTAYPTSRVVERAYDKLDRVNTILDEGTIAPLATFDYIGDLRVLRRKYPNGTFATALNNSGKVDIGYDGGRREVGLRSLRTDGSLIVGFEDGFDRMDNITSELKMHAPDTSDLLKYDSGYRLLEFDRGTLNPDGTAIDVPSPTPPSQSRWVLDGVGNWTSVDGEERQHSSFNEIIQMDDGATNVQSDPNGNVVDDGTFTYKWDSRDRLRSITRKSDGLPIAVYSYDILGRRLRSVVTNSGASNGTTDFFLDRVYEIEERNGAGDLTNQYVYGKDLNEPIVFDSNLDGDDSATGASDRRFFYHHNSRGSVFALTDEVGGVSEGYQYDAYGSPTVYTPGPNGDVDFGGDDVVEKKSAVGNPFLFDSARLDGESDLYYLRSRYLSPGMGRFLGRDPSGQWKDPLSRGNAYAYTGNNPATLIDPLGLQGHTRERMPLDYGEEWTDECRWVVNEWFGTSCVEKPGTRKKTSERTLFGKLTVFVESFVQVAGTHKMSFKFGGGGVEYTMEASITKAEKIGVKMELELKVVAEEWEWETECTTRFNYECKKTWRRCGFLWKTSAWQQTGIQKDEKRTGLKGHETKLILYARHEPIIDDPHSPTGKAYGKAYPIEIGSVDQKDTAKLISEAQKTAYK